jgi:hypothetical protein
MRAFLRCPLVSVATLTVYLLVNVAGALHHHHGAEGQPGRSPIASDTGLRVPTCSPADDDDEDDCPLCSVLHLAPILPTPCRVEAVTALTGKAFPAAAIARPHPLETATHSRAPPR